MLAKQFNALYPKNAGYDEARFKVEVHGVGDKPDSYVSNDLRFNTKEDAEAYAKDLFSRWTGIDDWRVADVVNDKK